MTTDLEERLAAALHARADQVSADRLRPTRPPRPARPAGRIRRGTAPMIAAAAAIAAVASLGVAREMGEMGKGDGHGGALGSPTASASPPEASQPDGPLKQFPLLPADSSRVTFLDDATGRFDPTPAGGVELVVRDGDHEWRSEDLENWIGQPALTPVSVPLGGEHTGYVVLDEDHVDPGFLVVTPWRGRLVVADWPVEQLRSPGSTSGSDATGFTTWIGSGPQLYTRDHHAGVTRSQIYTWQFPRPETIAEDATRIDLVPRPETRVCVDASTGTTSTGC